MVQSLLWAGPTAVQGASSDPPGLLGSQEVPRLFWVGEEYRSLLRVAELGCVETSTAYRGGTDAR
jgi:hypothetical protein